MARLVAAGVTLRAQVNKRWPTREKASDGWIGDRAHASRKSDHNPDGKGWVHALDIDADLLGPGRRARSRKIAQELADQLIEYARSGEPGSERLKVRRVQQSHSERHLLKAILDVAQRIVGPRKPHPCVIHGREPGQGPAQIPAPDL
jgi:hypothetical protein